MGSKGALWGASGGGRGVSHQLFLWLAGERMNGWVFWGGSPLGGRGGPRLGPWGGVWLSVGRATAICPWSPRIACMRARGCGGSLAEAKVGVGQAAACAALQGGVTSRRELQPDLARASTPRTDADRACLGR